MYVCNVKLKRVDGEYRCTREKGHPGQHCRFKMDSNGYHNIWWNDEESEKKEISDED